VAVVPHMDMLLRTVSGGSQSYVFCHACNAYGVNRALKILLYGRLSLPGDGFKARLAATEFLEVDAHTRGRRNRPNNTSSQIICHKYLPWPYGRSGRKFLSTTVIWSASACTCPV